MLIIFSFVAIIVALFYYYASKDRYYFKNRGIQYAKPTFLVGSQGKVLSKQLTLLELYDEIYRKHKDVGLVGFFEMTQPIYMVRDPELIKQILVKDFDSFINRRMASATDGSDSILSKTLLGAQGKIWKELRNLLSPAFTGSKMRYLYNLMQHCVETVASHVERETINGEYPLEARDFFSHCATDVIATTAFGVKLNSLETENNIFYRSGVELTNFKFLDVVKIFLVLCIPKITQLFNFQFLNQKASNNLISVLKDVIKQREINGDQRQDMVQLLLQAKYKGKIDDDQVESNQSDDQRVFLNDDYLHAQCFVFFLAGFETVTQFLSLMAYEIAINCEVQKTLQAEIDALDKELGGKSPTYEQLQKLSYLDMTIQEALRKWPPTGFSDRICNKSVTLKDFSGQSIQTKPGELFVFPTYSYHRDPQYFPDPEKFDPLRFSENNKRPEHKFVYQPFGLGPRQCIANRFATMEGKLFMYHLLLKFDFDKNVKTEVPLQMEKGVGAYRAINGIHVTFKIRDKK